MLYTFLIIYSIIILLIGIIVPKRVVDFENYFLAGRSLSWKSFSLTLSATWFGASSILVLTKESFLNGLSSIWIMIIPTLLTLSFFYIFSGKIRRAGVFSIPEILKKSYGGFFQFITSITIFFYLLLLSSSQAIALGIVINELLSLDYKISLIAGLGFVFLYSFRGGLISVVRTDFFQLFLVFLGLSTIIFTLITVANASGFYFSSEKLPLNFFDPFKNIKSNLLITFSFTLAWFISPVVWQRIVSAKTDKDAKIGLLLTSFLLLLLFALPTLIGIFERFIISDRLSGELVVIILNNQLNQIFRIIAFLAIISAIVSTLDSILNVSAMTLSNDIGRVILKNKIIAGRISLAISTFLTFIFSLPQKEILLALGLSSQILVCGLFVPLLSSIIFKNLPHLSGILSLLSGFLYSLMSYLKSGIGLKIPIPSWPESAPLGVFISFIFFLLGIIFDGMKKEVRG